jgi:hypothetical protein
VKKNESEIVIIAESESESEIVIIAESESESSADGS